MFISKTVVVCLFPCALLFVLGCAATEEKPRGTGGENGATPVDATGRPNTPTTCQTLDCPVATHCVELWGHGVCEIDPQPVTVDCTIPPMPKATGPGPDRLWARRYVLPQDGQPNNNGQIGPFCCTGRTLSFKGSDDSLLGYAYFFRWTSQAYIIGDTSYVRELHIPVEGTFDLPPGSPRITKDLLAFSAEDLAHCVSHSVQIGAYRITAHPRHADVWRPSCMQGDLAFDMRTATIVLESRWWGI